MTDLMLFVSAFSTAFNNETAAQAWLVHHKVFSEEWQTLALAGLSRFVTEVIESGVTRMECADAEEWIADCCKEELKSWGNGTRRRKVGAMQMGCEPFRSPVRREFMRTFKAVEAQFDPTTKRVLDLTLDATVAKRKALDAHGATLDERLRQVWKTGGTVRRQLAEEGTDLSAMQLSRTKKSAAAAFAEAGLTAPPVVVRQKKK
jgi:hypothetical protein